MSGTHSPDISQVVERPQSTIVESAGDDDGASFSNPVGCMSNSVFVDSTARPFIPPALAVLSRCDGERMVENKGFRPL